MELKQRKGTISYTSKGFHFSNWKADPVFNQKWNYYKLLKVVVLSVDQLRHVNLYHTSKMRSN